MAQKELNRLKTHPARPARVHGRAHLPRLDRRPALVEADRGQPRHRERPRRSSTHDHYGLEKVKKRILEYLAVRKLKNDMKGPILCLVGPPGVGKTSLGQSIARAIGRKFVRVSLGGVRDEAEIRGHRRTYVGALPGRIIQAMKKAGTNNPVFMLDEIDKLGADFRGDPSAALLEVLDPEQNNTFSDHYLDVPFDLSKVMFIATANLLDPIPPAARATAWRSSSCPATPARRRCTSPSSHLVPKQLEEHGLDRRGASTSPRRRSIEIIDGLHPRGRRAQPGARASPTSAARWRWRSPSGKVRRGQARRSTEADLDEMLGPQKFYNRDGRADRRCRAWPPAWPGRRPAATSSSSRRPRMPGKGTLTLTGQLGDVMKESAQAALSLRALQGRHARASPPTSSRRPTSTSTSRPAPSPRTARRPASPSSPRWSRCSPASASAPTSAMTGEITLRGLVLPVGGIKEKVLAAHRAGIKRIIMPERNEKDLVDVPEQARKELEFVFATHMDEVLKAALEENPVGRKLPATTPEPPPEPPRTRPGSPARPPAPDPPSGARPAPRRRVAPPGRPCHSRRAPPRHGCRGAAAGPGSATRGNLVGSGRDQDAGALRAARAGRERRHGRRLPRPGHRPRPRGGGQAAPPAPRPGRREPRPLLPRGPRRGPAVPPRHRRDLRLRRRRRRRRPTWSPSSSAAGRCGPSPSRSGFAYPEVGLLHRPRPGRRPGPRPRRRRHPPRPEAGERAWSATGERPAVKLTDFGIARILASEERMTMTGALVGSPQPHGARRSSRARRPTRAATSSPSAPSSTGWPPGSSPSPPPTRPPRSAAPSPVSSTTRASCRRGSRPSWPACSAAACRPIRPGGRPARRRDPRHPRRDPGRGRAGPPRGGAGRLPAPGSGRLPGRLPGPRRGRADRPQDEAALRGRQQRARARASSTGSWRSIPANQVVAAARSRALLRRRRLAPRRSRPRRPGRRRARAPAGRAWRAAGGRTRRPALRPRGGAPGPARPRSPDRAEPTERPARGQPGPPSRPGPARAGRRRLAPRPGRRRQPGRPPAAPPVELLVHVRPYAQRALLDGVEVASRRPAGPLPAHLGPAPHHPARARLLRPLPARDLPPRRPPRQGELRVPLEPRPARLRVEGDPATRILRRRRSWSAPPATRSARRSPSPSRPAARTPTRPTAASASSRPAARPRRAWSGCAPAPS